ncbi:unnamed protein product [Heligmosomoides polygyrus]|uniref:Reverse transcriptase domain-containing protein n=1 Tax=Heligmosomoides polygyrus TaxID=6339 RepID=A0A183F235_HELPZ|nr:unnamed protein product [Heligmosomoides polygyrus]
MGAIIQDLQKLVPWMLLYAEDVRLACDDLERKVQAWCDQLVLFELILNLKKTENLTTDVNESGFIKINGAELARTSVFMYLGSAIDSDGGLKVEVNSRVSAAWCKWCSLSGVLCDRKTPEHLKSEMGGQSPGQ